MNKSDIPYRQVIINLYTLISIVAFIIADFTLNFSTSIIFEWWLTITICLFPMALKLAAPRVPFLQIFICMIIVLSINYIAGIMIEGGFINIWILSSKAVEAVCVMCFGYFWTLRKYIPVSVNKW